MPINKQHYFYLLRKILVQQKKERKKGKNLANINFM